MGIKTITRITCDWCGKEKGPGDTLWLSPWTYEKEQTKTQRESVACSDECRGYINRLWKAMDADELRENSIRLFACMPPSPSIGEERGRTLFFELSPCTIRITEFRDLEITGTIRGSEVIVDQQW
jgi:hypothetical protein